MRPSIDRAHPDPGRCRTFVDRDPVGCFRYSGRFVLRYLAVFERGCYGFTGTSSAVVRSARDFGVLFQECFHCGRIFQWQWVDQQSVHAEFGVAPSVVRVHLDRIDLHEVDL